MTPTHNEVENQLRQFAETAVIHAYDRHGMRIGGDRFDLVDQIIDRERTSHRATELQSFMLCYGAWLGEWAVSKQGGKWVGLYEPTVPRVDIHGVVCDPIHAVERRILNAAAPTVQTLSHQIRDWAQSPVSDQQTVMHNRQAWDLRCADKRYVRSEAFTMQRDEAVAALDPWVVAEGPLDGKKILCLAAGGGRHSPLYAAAGALVTVVDFSDKQLEFDRQIARRSQLNIETILSSIEDLSAILDASFDIVVQPVSMSYLRSIDRVYSEIARVLKAGGLYVGQHKQPVSLQADAMPTQGGYFLRTYAEEGKRIDPTTESSLHRESEMTEFIHTWEALVGGLCRKGFVVEALEEPVRADAWGPIGSLEYRARFMPPYVKLKARRLATVP